MTCITLIKKAKFYKCLNNIKINIHPGDLKRLLDDYFYSIINIHGDLI